MASVVVTSCRFNFIFLHLNFTSNKALVMKRLMIIIHGLPSDISSLVTPIVLF